MKFLTDENIAASVIQALKKEGFDIKDIKEQSLQGTTDKKIIQLADKENRIIITHDKDFSYLFSTPTKNKGIILLRLINQKPDNVTKILLQLLNSHLKDKLTNNLTVVTETKATIHTKSFEGF